MKKNDMSIKIHDRANGCKGCYCIRRLCRDNPEYMETWSEVAGWTSFGTPYYTRGEAEAVLKTLKFIFKKECGK